ncbi:MAG: helix-turn-helix domain-containing protein [Planctomycetes bacterium]|nr:helix-turn-helix domain-containing protein [Planctomycetota bacterium]
MDIKARLGQRLRALRTQRGLTQDGLARLARVDRVFLGQVERGEKGAGIETLDKLARALGVAPRELLDFGRPQQDPPTTNKDRLLRRLEALLRDAPKEELERFEALARAFFRPFAGRKRSRPSS